MFCPHSVAEAIRGVYTSLLARDASSSSLQIVFKSAFGAERDAEAARPAQDPVRDVGAP
jgi:hypothetical protein